MDTSEPMRSPTKEPIKAPIKAHTEAQRSLFSTHKTQPVTFRRQQLKRIKASILAASDDILAALKADLGKCETEAYLSEIALSISDIDYALKHLSSWTKQRRVSLPIAFQPSRGKVAPEPKGVVLIISPWNYPFQLAIGPLVSAIASGNCAIIKPSEIAPHTSAVLAKLITATFPPDYVSVIEGDAQTSQALLAEPFDHIFFTGSPAIGKVVMRAAAEHLTPVTLELGGKSPCVVTASADIKVAARRIVWGKCFNAGQTCIAPDYLLVEESVKDELMGAIAQATTDLFGEDMETSPDYGRIVSDRHFRRLRDLMTKTLAVGHKVIGGHSNPDTRYIGLTVIDQLTATTPAMQEEIFGPILPVLTFQKFEEAIAFINQRPKPLALYLFSADAHQQQTVQTQTSSGSLAFNETISQYAIQSLPFGGIGQSGMGAGHGKAGFDTFSHYKSILKNPTWLDIPLRYPPYAGKLPWLKRIL